MPRTKIIARKNAPTVASKQLASKSGNRPAPEEKAENMTRQSDKNITETQANQANDK